MNFFCGCRRHAGWLFCGNPRGSLSRVVSGFDG